MPVRQGAAEGIIFVHALGKGACEEHVDDGKGLVDFKIVDFRLC